MKLHDTALPEVKRLTLTAYPDQRGFFRELFSNEAFAALGFSETLVQWNHSRSVPGVVRGIHFQHTPMQGKLVGVTRGAVMDVAVDLRPHSANFGKHVAVELSAENNEMLWIPAGFGHGFCVLGAESADMVYGMSARYNGAGEGGIAYNDPALAIAWPVPVPTVSERDAMQPSLASAHPDLTHWFGDLR